MITKKRCMVFTMFLILSVLVVTLPLVSVEPTRGPANPFPQGITYPGCIKPQAGITQQQMNEQVKLLYVEWINDRIRESNGATPGGGYYVDMNIDPTGGGAKTTSVAHGNAMIIFALMAGVDLSGIQGSAGVLDAKVYFDGMYNMYDKHRSRANYHLMSSTIDNSESISLDGESETTGDLDIAYALILAHVQWGSNGPINYIAEAQRIITFGIKESEICPKDNRVMVGDWSDWSSYIKRFGTRTANWRPGHFRAFYAVTGDQVWLNVVNEIYSMIDYFQTNYSPNSGLICDVVVCDDPILPAYEGWPEGTDLWLYNSVEGQYANLAYQLPWFLAVDYAHYGEQADATALNKIADWAIPAHTDPGSMEYNPENVVNGYNLQGGKLFVPEPGMPAWPSPDFAATFATAFMVNANNQTALDRSWSYLTAGSSVYFDNKEVQVLSALLLSGNWWSPEYTPTPPLTNISPGKVWSASAEYSAEYKVANIADEIDGTIWGALAHKPVYITVDLGKLTPISGVRLDWFGDFFATNYQIYISNDGAKWTKVLDIVNGNGGIDEYIIDGSVNVRYVGFYFTRSFSSAYALKELEILSRGR